MEEIRREKTGLLDKVSRQVSDTTDQSSQSTESQQQVATRADYKSNNEGSLECALSLACKKKNPEEKIKQGVEENSIAELPLMTAKNESTPAFAN